MGDTSDGSISNYCVDVNILIVLILIESLILVFHVLVLTPRRSRPETEEVVMVVGGSKNL